MNNEVTVNDVEIIKEGLSYEEELKLLAKRFGMTEMQAKEYTMHRIYTSGINKDGLDALE